MQPSQFCCGSFNVRRLKRDSREDFVCDVLSRVHVDILCLQEVDLDHSLGEPDIQFHHGHVLIIFPCSMGANVGFLIHRRWRERYKIISWKGKAGAVELQLGNIVARFITSHMPTTNDMNMYLGSLQDVMDLWTSGGRCCFIGCDANAVLGARDRSQDDPGHHIHSVGECVHGNQDERGVHLEQWAVGRGLVASSTFTLRAGSGTTRVPDGGDHVFHDSKQIDYVFTDSQTHRRHTETFIDEEISAYVASDHHLVYSHFDFSQQLVYEEPIIKAPKPIRWRARDVEQFRDHVSAGVCDLRRRNGLNLQTVTGQIVESAMKNCQSPSADVSDSRRSRRHKSQEEKELLRLRNMATSRQDKSNLTKQIWRRRRKD